MGSTLENITTLKIWTTGTAILSDYLPMFNVHVSSPTPECRKKTKSFIL